MAAMRKNISWMARIVIPEMAKWSVSRMFTAMFLSSDEFAFLLIKLFPNVFSAATASISDFQHQMLTVCFHTQYFTDEYVGELVFHESTMPERQAIRFSHVSLFPCTIECETFQFYLFIAESNLRRKHKST